MERRNFITALIALPALGLLAACGSDSSSDSLATSDTTADSTPESTTEPEPDPATTPPAVEAAVSAVLSYTEPGGFTMSDFAFQNAPLLLVSDAGTIITPAPVAAIFPGPLLPQHTEQSITPTGVDAVLAAADDAGLLADVDYSREDNIADASTATLTITVDGATYTHEAYALGIGGGLGAAESTPERQALLDFLTALAGDPAGFAGAENLGTPASYVPTAYQFIATPVEDVSGFDPAPTVEAWPGGTGVELAAALDCVELDRDVIGDVFEQANQLTFFSENGATYQVTVRPAYPGRSC